MKSFKENRLIFADAASSPETSDLIRAGGESSENLSDRIKRLEAVEKMLSKEETEKLEKAELSAETSLYKDPALDTPIFGLIELNRLTDELAGGLHPTDTALKSIQSRDFRQAFNENPFAGVIDFNSKLEKEKEKYDTVKFHKKKNEDFFQVTLSGDGGKKQKNFIQFDIKSQARRKAEGKRETVLKELRKQRADLEKQEEDVKNFHKEVSKFKSDLVKTLDIKPQCVDIQKTPLKVGENPETVIINISKLNAEMKPMSKAASIMFTYENGQHKYAISGPSIEQKIESKPSDKFQRPSFETTEDYIRSWYFDLYESATAELLGHQIIGRSETDKLIYADYEGHFYYVDGNPVTDENDAKGLKKQDIDKAIEKAKAKRLQTIVEEEEKSAKAPGETPTAPETPTVAVEKIKEKVVNKIELTKDPDTKLRTLIITTKKGTKLTYKEIGTRTPDNKAIWRYADTDEYYLDTGGRIDPSGFEYTGTGQKESKILGQHVKILRDTERDIEDLSGAKVSLTDEAKDSETNARESLLITLGPKTVENVLDLHFRLVKEKLSAPDHHPTYSSIDALVKTIADHGKSITAELGEAYNKIEINFHGVGLVWTKENGFEDPENKDLLTVKVIQILKNFLEPEEYEAFMAREKTMESNKRMQESKETAETEWKKDMYKRLTKSYNIQGFEDKGLSEGDIADNWALLDGAKEVTTVLNRHFLVTTEAQGAHGISEHEIPKLAAAMISEYSNESIDYLEIFKFATPNIAGKFDAVDAMALKKIVGGKSLPDLQKLILDRKELDNIVEKGTKLAEKDEMVQDFMNKLFEYVVKPTIQLLEALQNLKFSNARKEKQPEKAEELIWMLMEKGEETYSEFSLPAGNRFRLNEVSQYHNSNELEIGINGGLVESVKDRLSKDNTIPEKEKSYIAKIDTRVFLKSLFRLISPETLVKQGCLEMNTNKQILITKLPKEISDIPAYILDQAISIIDGTAPDVTRTEIVSGGFDTMKTYPVGVGGGFGDIAPRKKEYKYHSDMEIMKEKLRLIDKETLALKTLQDLCGEMDDRNWLKSFVDACKGNDDFVYLTQLDGSTFFKDKSRMQRQMTGKAAENFILYNGTYYDIDAVKGHKTLNIEKLENEINRFIQLGALQMFLERGGEKGKAPTKEQVDEALKPGSEFQQKLNRLKIRYLGKREDLEVTKEQKEAFQFGLLVEYNTKYEEQMEGLKMPENPAMRAWFEWALSTGAKASQIKTAANKFKAAIGVLVSNSGSATAGVGAGYTFDLGHGFSFTLGAAAGFGTILSGGGALAYEFKGPGDSEFTVGLLFNADATGGVGGGLGIQNVHRYGKSQFEGIALLGVFGSTSYGVLPGLAYGVRSNYDYAVEVKLDEMFKDDHLGALRDAMGAYDRGEEGAREKLMELARKSDQFGPLFEEKIGGKLPLSEQTIISLMRFQLFNVQSKAATEAKKGFVSALVLGFPTYVTFSIGTGTVSRPLLKSEARLLGINSSMCVDSDVEEELKLQDLTGVAVERMSQAYITSDGRIGRLVGESKRADFSRLADNEFCNSQLGKLNMRVENVFGGTERVLHIFDADDIELEVHVDPLLDGEVAVHTRNGEGLTLEGNLEDMVITRERFFFPATTKKHGSTVRDVVTIRKKKSVRGERDRLWIQENEAAYLEKLPEYSWTVKQGESARYQGASQTVFDVRGWNSGENERLKRGVLEARKEESESEISDASLKDKLDLIEQHQDAIPSTQFEPTTEKVQKGIKTGIDKAIEDKKHYKAIAARMDSPEELAKYIAEHEAEMFDEKILGEDILGEDKKLSDLERNLAIQYLTRRYFIDLASKAMKEAGITEADLEILESVGTRTAIEFLKDDKRREKFVKYINKTREILFKNAEYVAKAFEKEFDEAIKRLKERGETIDPKLTGKDIANQMVKDIKSNVPGVTMKTSPANLINHPLLTLEVESMWEGSTICYGTHKAPSEEGGRHVPAMARTIQAMATAERTVRPAGLLKGTATEYPEGSDMAKILLETADPLPALKELATYREFLKSEFATKIAGIGAIIFELGNDDYRRVMETFKNPDLLSKPEYAASVKEFYELCSLFRRNQLAGKPTEIRYRDLLFEFKLGSKSRSMAWADCGNAGFEALEVGAVQISKAGRTIVAFHESYEVLEESVRKQYIDLTLGITIGFKKKPPKKKPPREKPPRGGKHLKKTGQAGQKRGSTEPTKGQPAHHPEETPTNYASDSDILGGF